MPLLELRGLRVRLNNSWYIHLPPPSPQQTFSLLIPLCCLQDNQNDHNPGTPGEGEGQFSNLLPFSQDNVSQKLTFTFSVLVRISGKSVFTRQECAIFWICGFRFMYFTLFLNWVGSDWLIVNITLARTTGTINLLT